MSLRGLLTFVFSTRNGQIHCTRRISGPLALRRHCRTPSFSTSASQLSWPVDRRACASSHDAGRLRSTTCVVSVPQSHRWRGLHSSAVRGHEPIVRPEPGTGIKIHFQDSKGSPLKTVEATDGDNILDLAHEYDIDLEGACEGSVACSTCHVILTPEHYDMLPEPEDDENDMLDMAFGLTDTSRLGCQVKVTPALAGMVVKLPSATRNMFVDGVKPTKH